MYLIWLILRLFVKKQSLPKSSHLRTGKDYVEVDGTEYSDSDIRNILTEAEDYLSEKIPQRAQFLQEKQYWVEDTIKTFPWSQSGEGEECNCFQSVREGKQYKQLLDQLPNGDFIAATVVEGINAIKSSPSKSSGKAKSKSKNSSTYESSGCDSTASGR